MKGKGEMVGLGNISVSGGISGEILSGEAILIVGENLFQNFGHVFNFLEDVSLDVNGRLLQNRQVDTIAGAGVQFDDFFAQLVFHRENHSGKEGAFPGIIDHDSLQNDLKPLAE